MWIEVEDSAGNQACLPFSDELWTFVLDISDEIAASQPYVQSLIESMIRRMKLMVKAQGLWTS